MDVSEFRMKFKELLMQFATDDNNYDVFCLIKNIEDGAVSVEGFGCPRCMVEELSSNVQRFHHTNPRRNH